MEHIKNILTRHVNTPGRSLIDHLVGASSPAEKTLIGIGVVLIVFGALAGILAVNQALSTTVPASGGTIEEGIVGTPRFANPLLATSEVDTALVAFVYSGLMRANTDGEFIPDLAERVEISEDRRSYTFTMRDGATFHDGEPVTAKDVLFTIELVKNGALRSPVAPIWSNVEVRSEDKRHITLTLAEPYTPFLAHTTLGILPSHIWEEYSVDEIIFNEANINPIGSGPFKLKQIKRNDNGIPTAYFLERFNDFALGAPFLERVILRFYENEEARLEAFLDGDITLMGSVNPEHAVILQDSNIALKQVPLFRTFAVFFNQNKQRIFTEDAIREALSLTIDRKKLVSRILDGYGTPAKGALPSQFLPDTPSLAYNPQRAARILEEAGWEYDPEDGLMKKETDGSTEILQFTLRTSNNPEIKQLAEELRAQWSVIGVHTTLEFFDVTTLTSSVIRPRDYDALLFGQVIDQNGDVFPFWHSSERNDPGLNVALYANIEADGLLEDIRTEVNAHRLEDLYEELNDILTAEHAAIFLYNPSYILAFDGPRDGIPLGNMTRSADQYTESYKWFIYTNNIWEIFTR